jgi:acetylornithine/succinyldiaminopimelate/putrescine aminotransferase
MISQRTLFLQHVGQTSPFPIGLEIERASGIYIYDTSGKEYIDLVSGVSVSNVGHCHPDIVNAIKNQVDKYMHLMVYGEFIQKPQVAFAKKIADILPPNLQSVYFVNSGSEAIEGAMKLAKRFTGRRQILAFTNAYHGSTQGALSIYGGKELTSSVQPLLPEISFLDFNSISSLEAITTQTACVVMEVIQAEAGVIMPHTGFLEKVRRKCSENGFWFLMKYRPVLAGQANYLHLSIFRLFPIFSVWLKAWEEVCQSAHLLLQMKLCDRLHPILC